MSKYEVFKKAKEIGGCGLCGWKDGDGVKVCYYDEELGVLKHENSIDMAKSKMTTSEKSLYESYESYIHGVMRKKTREKVKAYLIGLVKEDKEWGWRLGCSLYSRKKYKTKEEVADAWIGSGNLEDYLKAGYAIKRSRTEENKGTLFENFNSRIVTYDLQRPHTCGGFAEYVAPYHIACSKCEEEIRLWEFGVDYDVG